MHGYSAEGFFGTPGEGNLRLLWPPLHRSCHLLVRLLRHRRSRELLQDAHKEIQEHYTQSQRAARLTHCVGLDDHNAPSPASLGTSGPTHVKTWLVPQLSPIVSSGILPNVLDETTIHTIPLPFARVSQDSKKLYDFIYTHRSALLDFAVEEFGLPRDEACHDLLFNMGFNAFGGMLIFFPNIVKYVAKAGEDLHREIVKEFRGAVEGNEGLNMKVLESMPLVRSVVYEALRMDLHAALQYGRAKTGFMVESYDAAYEVKKGEFLGGYQPLATKDPSVFANAEDFVAGRFMGEEGEKLWQYVVWSNGPKTEMPMTDNNKCAGKDIVVMVARLLVAHLFLCDDSFALDESLLSAIFTQFTKAFQK